MRTGLKVIVVDVSTGGSGAEHCLHVSVCVCVCVLLAGKHWQQKHLRYVNVSAGCQTDSICSTTRRQNAEFLHQKQQKCSETNPTACLSDMMCKM